MELEKFQQMENNGCPLSRLGDDIVTQILSLLPIDAVVRTSLLSRQWNRIWTRVPVSDINLALLETGSESTRVQALSFLTRFVTLQNTNGLTSKRLIRLSVVLDTRSVASAFENLMALAGSCGFTLDLDIRIRERCPEMVRIREAVCSATSLTSLRLHNRLSLQLIIPTLNWPDLRVLYLSTSGFMDANELLGRLRASCPVLECLVFDRCLFIDREIRVAGFRRLLRFKFRGGKDCRCLISKVSVKDTPRLQVLHCRGVPRLRIEVEIDPATSGRNLEVLKLKLCFNSECWFNTYV